MRTINAAGMEIVKRWEGILDGDPTTVNLDPYLDPVGVWTIGWGHAIVDPLTKQFVRGQSNKKRAFDLYPGGITISQAEDLLRADLLDAAKDVSALVKVPLTDNQFSALVSFHFNTGGLSVWNSERWVPSTMRRKLNASDFGGAALEFEKWVKGRVKGKLVVLDGLVKRRAEERRLFLS